MDNNLPVIPKKLLSKVKTLILKFCCNIDGGNCLRLDDGIPARCPQIGAPRVICRWFCDAVLPGDEDLSDAIMGKTRQWCYSTYGAKVHGGWTIFELARRLSY